MPPFRFGIQLSRSGDLRSWRETARKIEGLGYSSVFIPDHFGDQFGPLVALTVAAEATSTLKVGSLVFDNDYRHPLVLAKECATLDLASEGRLEVGLGAGWMRTDYDESGIEYEDPKVRVDRLDEAIDIVKALWSDELVDFEGTHYKLSKAQGLPRPYTPGGPPLLIGGGSRRVLRIAAEKAKIIGINPSLRSGATDAATVAGTTPDAYAERIGWVREFAGDRISEIELQSLVFLAQIGRPQAVVAEEMAQMFGYPAEQVAATPIAVFGTEDEIVETLQGRREEFGYSYWVFHEAEIDSFAPVVARLAGT